MHDMSHATYATAVTNDNEYTPEQWAKITRDFPRRTWGLKMVHVSAEPNPGAGELGKAKILKKVRLVFGILMGLSGVIWIVWLINPALACMIIAGLVVIALMIGHADGMF